MMTIAHDSRPEGTTDDISTRSRAWPDRVSEDSADSFPASDPPSWSPQRVGSPGHDSRGYQEDT